MIKSDQVQKLLLEAQSATKKCNNNIEVNKNVKSHLIRSIMIVIDMTKSMQIKDLKPSRLGLSIQMVKLLIKQSKDQTPIINFALAVVEQQLCKVLVNFTCKEEEIIETLDTMKILQDPGFFSLQNTLRVSLDTFQSCPLLSHRELLLIQSSTYSKDYRNIFQTIRMFAESKINLNIVSLSGYNKICQKLVESCHGRYTTITSPEYFKNIIQQISKPMLFEQHSLKKGFYKVAWCRKQALEVPAECFCHLKLHRNLYICGFCSAPLCKSPPSICTICGTNLLFPSDLYRHH